jgi:hypothetical protein
MRLITLEGGGGPGGPGSGPGGVGGVGGIGGVGGVGGVRAVRAVRAVGAGDDGGGRGGRFRRRQQGGVRQKVLDHLPLHAVSAHGGVPLRHAPRRREQRESGRQLAPG